MIFFMIIERFVFPFRLSQIRAIAKENGYRKEQGPQEKQRNYWQESEQLLNKLLI